MAAARTVSHRIARASIEEGMRLVLPDYYESDRPTRRNAYLTVKSVEHDGDTTRIVARGGSVIFTIVAGDPVEVIPEEGEIWF